MPNCPTAPAWTAPTRLVKQMSAIARDAEKVPGVWHTIDLPGYSALLGTNISNVGGMFVILEPFEERKGDPEKERRRHRHEACASSTPTSAAAGSPCSALRRSTAWARPADSSSRCRTVGGAGLRALQGSVQNLADQGNADPRLVGLFSSFTVNQPQLYVQIDRDKLKAQKVSLDDVNQTLQAYLGGLYVNDVTLFNRNWQVNVQADARFRLRKEDIGRLEVRNAEGERVPLETLIKVTRRQRAGNRQPLQQQPVRRTQAATWRRASVPARRSQIMDQLCGRLAADDHEDRLDGDHAATDHCQQGHSHQAGFSAGSDFRVPRAGGAIRKLVAAAVDYSHRADVPAGVDRGHLADEDGQQHLHADRPGGADRLGGEERHSDRRVRQTEAGPGREPLRRHRRSLPLAACGRS